MTFPCIHLFVLILALVLPSVALPAAPPEGKTTAAGPFGTVHRAPRQVREDARPLMPKELERKTLAERLDRKGLLSSSRVVTDSAPGLLVPPASVIGLNGKEFTIAETPPVIEFAIAPVEPKFFSEPPPGNKVGPWSNWSQGVYNPRNGKFYSSAGDHGGYGAHLYLIEYDPASKRVRCLPEINRVLGRTPDRFGDGKIHGWLGFSDDRTLWFATYWAKYPEPAEEDYATGYGGGYLMSCDVVTGDITDYGVPVGRVSWPYFNIDRTRGKFFAVGRESQFLAWDMKTQRTLWAGYPPEGLEWAHRSVLVDEVDGMAYSSNSHASDPEMHLIRYDPAKNRFFKLDCAIPPNRTTGERTFIRAHTRHRGPDGLFWCVSQNGELFTFDPVRGVVEDKGLIWPGKQTYVASMDRSPGGRFIYFVPGAHGGGWAEGAPIVQYDTKTGGRKVIAFPFPYYHETYGYITGGTYSAVLDDAGARLCILWNGAFTDIKPGGKADTFGHCSVMLVNIPENERRE